LTQIHKLKPKLRVKKGYIEILTVKCLYEGKNCDWVLKHKAFNLYFRFVI